MTEPEVDMFGKAMEELRKHKRGKHYVEPKGYAAPPGTGPEGHTCGDCKHLARVQYAKTYLKCALMKKHWTGGGGTDVRAKSPACSKWEADK